MNKAKAKSIGNGKPSKKKLKRKVKVRSITGHSPTIVIKRPGRGIDVMKGVCDALGHTIEMQIVIQKGTRIHPWTELDDEVDTYHLTLALGPDRARAPRGARDDRWRCSACMTSHQFPHKRQVIVDVGTGKQVCSHSYCYVTRPIPCVDEGKFVVKCRSCEAKGFLY